MKTTAIDIRYLFLTTTIIAISMTGCGSGGSNPDIVTDTMMETVQETVEQDTAVSDVSDTGEPDTPVTDSGQDVLAIRFFAGPEGGSHEFPGGVRITVPSGALAQETEISISRHPWTDEEPPMTVTGDSVSPVGEIWEFQPEGLEFTKQITITIPYAEFAGIGRELKGFWTARENDRFEMISDTSAADGFGTFKVDHFSLGFIGFVVSEAPWIPEGMTFNAARGQAVAPNFVPTIELNAPLDPDSLDFKMKTDDADVSGLGVFSSDLTRFYFFPDHLLTPAKDYEITFVYDDITWKLDIVVSDAVGTMPVTGNADVEGDTAFSFLPIIESFVEPSEYASSMMAVYRDFFTDTYLIAPLFFESTGSGLSEFVFGVADSLDFDGDGDFEPNHTTTGMRMAGESRGRYFLYNGPVTLTRVPGGVMDQAVSITIDKIYVSGKVEVTGNDKPAISSGIMMIHSADCDAPLEFWQEPQVQAAINLVCNQSTNSIFGYLGFSAMHNNLDKQKFTLEAVGPQGVQVAFQPGLQAKYEILRESHVVAEITQGGQIVRSSTDFPGSISVPKEWETKGNLWESFKAVRFTLPPGSELAAGSYRLRLIIGLDAFETGFVVN